MSLDIESRAQERENVDPEETIRPIPLAAAVVTLVMVVFGVLYIFFSEPLANSQWGDERTLADLSGPRPAAAGAAVDGKALFAAHCAACHQATGMGLPGAFPPLKGDPVVLDANPAKHIQAILHGVQGQTINGTAYPSPMPPFGATLSDSEVADIVNHERTSWGNQARNATADEVKAAR